MSMETRDGTGANTEAVLPSGVQYISVVPEPGTICPTCGEKTPNKHALEVRAWRAKRKEKGR